MRARWLLVFASASVAAGFVACNLNPQPLPPEDLGAESDLADAAFGGDGQAAPPAPTAVDAGGGNDKEGGADASEASDAGDAGDADAGDASDADADAG